MLAGGANISKNANRDVFPVYCKAVGFRCIMSFRESIYAELANVYRDIRSIRLHKLGFEPQPAFAIGCSRDVNRYIVFPGDEFRTPGMISMFVGDEDGIDLSHRQSEPAYPLFRFPAGDTCIDQYGFTLITNIIAIAIASGSK
jgi:hypothetical protein